MTSYTSPFTLRGGAIEAQPRRKGDAGRRTGRAAPVGDRAPDRGRRLFRRRGSRAGRAGAHHGRPESLGAARRGVSGKPRRGTRRRQRRVRIPTITDPRGVDFRVFKKLGQQQWMADLERARHRRLRGARHPDDQYLHQLSDHHAAGAAASTWPMATPASSSIPTACSARAAISRAGPRRWPPALTGRTPRYGYHLDETAAARIAMSWSSSRGTGATGARSAG